jgi:hypothetical protein
MATKIAPFTLKDPDICVKCGQDMPEGTHATWLREPECKGYYHPTCEAKPIIAALTKIKVPAADSPVGYVWMRQNAIPCTEGPELKPLATILAAAATPLPGPWKEQPQVSADGILLNALAQAILPKIHQQIAEAIKSQQPRIIVNVYCPKPGDEVKALDLLSKELFLLEKVNEL